MPADSSCPIEVSFDQAGGLRERLAGVPDPRGARGVRHSLVSILLITVCALAAGKNGYTAIEAWARDAPAHVLSALDVRFDVFTARHICPDESTIRTVLARVDRDQLSAAGCGYLLDLAEHRARTRTDAPDEREARRTRTNGQASATRTKAFAVDGKHLVASRRPDGTQVTLLSMVEHQDGVTRAQREITDKGAEIREARILLHQVNLKDAVLTLDALHTRHATAEAIVTAHHGAYVLAIKRNQPTLWNTAAARFTQPTAFYQANGQFHTHTTRGHGRIETREIRTAPAENIAFPHAAQIFQITRRSKKPGARAWDRKEIAFGITSLSARQAPPRELAAHTQGHWSIENKCNHVRDVTFREDANHTRTAHAPANLATLRNLVIGTLRHAGHTNIAHARSLQANNYNRALTLFNL